MTEAADPPPTGPDLDATWQRTLLHLQGQMDRHTFDLSLRASRLLAAHDGLWTVAVPTPAACDALARRLAPTIRRTVSLLHGRDVHLDYVVAAPSPAPPVPASPALPVPAPPPASLLSFDPNSAEGGGFTKLGHYATWFWAPLVGPVAWRVYELILSGDRRRDKTAWTPPRRYSIGELARAVAGGRGRHPNRDQIRGRYRTAGGQRRWQPGAFDRLTAEGLARIEWHDGTPTASGCAWQPWLPGGPGTRRPHGLHLVYRLSVVTSLPLLTPHQVARLTPALQVAHERYLIERSLDLAAWEQVAQPTLCAGAGLTTEL